LTIASGVQVRAAASAQVIIDDLTTLSMSDGDTHHLFRVRRLRDGETVIVTDGVGRWQETRVAGEQLRPVGDIIVEQRERPMVTVAFAPVKGDRSEWAVAKLTETGCDRIVALATARAAVRWNDASAAKALQRWRRVAREASCQSRRVWLPEIEGPATLEALAGEGGVALAVPGGAPLATATHTIAVGPEGGWTEAERSLRFPEVALAAHVLRTETAAIAAGVLLEACRQGTVAPMGNGKERDATEEEPA